MDGNFPRSCLGCYGIWNKRYGRRRERHTGPKAERRSGPLRRGEEEEEEIGGPDGRQARLQACLMEVIKFTEELPSQVGASGVELDNQISMAILSMAIAMRIQDASWLMGMITGSQDL